MSAHDDSVDVPIEGTLDLHAFAPRDVVSVVEEYVEAAQAAGFVEVRLVHGRGKGVQHGTVTPPRRGLPHACYAAMSQ